MRYSRTIKTNSLSWWQGIRHTIVTNNRCTAFHKEDYHLCLDPVRRFDWIIFSAWTLPRHCVKRQWGGGFGQRHENARILYARLVEAPWKKRDAGAASIPASAFGVTRTHVKANTDISSENFVGEQAWQSFSRGEISAFYRSPPLLPASTEAGRSDSNAIKIFMRSKKVNW